MKIKKKSALIVSGSFFILLIASITFYWFVILADFLRVEESLITRNVNRVKEVIAAEQGRVQDMAVDWAQWDDMYNYMENPNTEFYSNWMTYDSYEGFRISRALFFSLEKKLMFGIQVDFQSKKVGLTDPGDTFEDFARKLDDLFTFDEENISKSQIVKVGGGVYAFASAPILDSSKEKPSRGTLVVVRRLDTPFIKQLARQTKLSVDISPNYTFSPARIHEDDYQPIVEREDENTIAATFPVMDGGGFPVLSLKITEARPIYQQALQTLRWFFIFWAASAGTVIAVMFGLLNRFIIRRVERICSSLRNISETRNFSSAIENTGSDEITEMSKDLNKMLRSLELAYSETTSARDEAERANAAKSAFIAKVSHEVRSPMHGILGMLRIILKANLAPAIRQHLGMIKDSSEGLLSIINDILDFSKFSSGTIPLERVEFSVAHLVRDVVNTIGGKAYEKEGLELSGFVGPTVPLRLMGDPLRLKQILVNLVGNSVKFTSSGYVMLSVNAVQGTDDIYFVVSDTGVGIPEDRLPSIFEPFTQADDSASRRYSGTGLGLTITKQLAEAMGGGVSVTSVLGKGTSFTVKIPLRAAPTVEIEKDQLPSYGPKAALLAEPGHITEFVTRAISTVKGTTRTITSTAGKYEITLEDKEILFVDGSWLEKLKLYDLIEQTSKKYGLDRVAVLVAPHQLPLREQLGRMGIDRVLNKPTVSSDVIRAAYGQFVDGRMGDDSQDADEVLRTSKLRILVAEDNHLNQVILRGLLEENGFTVSCVDNGQQMVNSLYEIVQNRARNVNLPEGYDVVITDIQMPVMDGLEATGLVRKEEDRAGVGRWGRMPILALTANAFQEEHAKIMKGGVDAVVTKPLNAHELWRSLRNLMRSGRIDLSRQVTATPSEAKKPETAAPSADCVAELNKMAEQAVKQVLESTDGFMAQLSAVLQDYSRDASVTTEKIEKIEPFMLSIGSVYDRSGKSIRRLNKVVEAFLSSYKDLLASLDTACQKADAAEIRIAGHTLKGMLNQAGCEAGGYIAFQIEKAGRDGQIDQAQAQASKLRAVTEEFAVVLTNFLTEMKQDPAMIQAAAPR